MLPGEFSMAFPQQLTLGLDQHWLVWRAVMQRLVLVFGSHFAAKSVAAFKPPQRRVWIKVPCWLCTEALMRSFPAFPVWEWPGSGDEGVGSRASRGQVVGQAGQCPSQPGHSHTQRTWAGWVVPGIANRFHQPWQTSWGEELGSWSLPGIQSGAAGSRTMTQVQHPPGDRDRDADLRSYSVAQGRPGCPGWGLHGAFLLRTTGQEV